MPKRFVLVAVLAMFPSLALAQGVTPNAPVCDGSEIRRAERTRDIGGALFFGTVAADLVAALTIPRNPGGVGTAKSHFAFMAATAPVGLTGILLAKQSHPGEKFWQRVIPRLKVGETRADDVSLCLHRPAAWSSSVAEERWTYMMTRPSDFAGTVRTLRLTFRDSVLTNVERSEVRHQLLTPQDASASGSDRHRGYCMPPIPAVADPFPTPTDTTAAAAAMARAQADADAAMKNAAAAAAYASCMASDSAQ